MQSYICTRIHMYIYTGVSKICYFEIISIYRFANEILMICLLCNVNLLKIKYFPQNITKRRLVKYS